MTIFWLSLAVGLSQECSTGLGHSFPVNVKLAKIDSYPNGRWSPTRRRLPKSMVVSRSTKGSAMSNPFQGSGRRSRQPDFPLERCAILAFTGVGTGYLSNDEKQLWTVGAPSILVATAMPFPGNERRGQFWSKSNLGKRALGLLAFTVSYAVGTGVGQSLRHELPE